MTLVAPNLACGEARRGRIPSHGAVTDEQRSHRPNSAQPGGRQVFLAQTSLLAPHRSTAGYARRSRLASAQNPLPRMYSYFGDTTLAACAQEPAFGALLHPALPDLRITRSATGSENRFA